MGFTFGLFVVFLCVPGSSGVQYVGSCWSGGVLCHSPVLPLPEHSLPGCMEHGRRGEGD